MAYAFFFISLASLIQEGCCLESCGYYARDCQDIQDLGFTKSGVYHVIPHGTHDGYDVYCDMDTDGGGWLVFQRRINGSVDFYREWSEYELGFGDLLGEHWLGNIALYKITSHDHYQLQVDLEDWEGNSVYANYKIFRVSNSLEQYKLEVAGYFGTAGDSMTFHSGEVFQAKDMYCALQSQGAWWYVMCHQSNLNGKYYRNGSHHIADGNKGIVWKSWKTGYSLKTTEMKLKRT